MFLKTKIATGAVAGVLTLAMTGAAALAAFQPVEAMASASVRGTDTQASAAEREKNTGGVQALEAILERLVQNGAITAEQKAEIIAAVSAAREDGDRDRHLKRILGGLMALSVEYLSLSKEDVREALRTGTSLGGLADATEGKSREGLILFLVVEATALVDQAVAAEEVTDERATAAKAGLAEKATRFVDHVYEKRVAKDRAKERTKELKERAEDLRERFKERRTERKQPKAEEPGEDD